MGWILQRKGWELFKSRQPTDRGKFPNLGRNVHLPDIPFGGNMCLICSERLVTFPGESALGVQKLTSLPSSRMQNK